MQGGQHWTLLVAFACLLVAPLVLSNLHTIPLIPHHVQRERRQLALEDLDGSPRRRAKGALTVGALYQGYGTHYVDLWVGQPKPQRQTVIVDTGSGVTAFPCSGCHDCGDTYHIDKFFTEEASKTFEKLDCSECTRGSCHDHECRIGMSYQEGSSWSAYEARDVTYCGGPHDEPLDDKKDGEDIDPKHASAFAFPLKFGCQTKITGLFKTQLADGIMGMDSASTAYWSQMNKAGVLKEKRFSLCYSRQPTSDRDGTEAGALTFGGTEERLHTSPMVYTGGKKGRVGFFSVHMRKAYLRQGGGGDSATSLDSTKKIITLDVDESTLNRGGIIVDSGTTDTYFSRSISSAFQKAFKELTGKSYNHDAVDLTAEQLDALPTILFQIAGDEDSNKDLYGDKMVTGLAGEALDTENPYDVILAIPPSHYMEFDHKKMKYIARFYVDEGGGSVLGGNAIMGHDVFFDIDNKRIGWAESRCDYTELVKDYSSDSTPVDEAESKKEQEEETHAETHDPDTTSLDKKDKPTTEDHETDDHSDHVDAPPAPSPKQNVLEVCNDMSCRGAVIAAFVGVLFVGIFVGRFISRGSSARYHRTELEVPTLRLDEDDAVDFTPRYRDHPQGEDDDDDDDDEGDDVAAEEGTGYEDDDDDDKVDLREIA